VRSCARHGSRFGVRLLRRHSGTKKRVPSLPPQHGGARSGFDCSLCLIARRGSRFRVRLHVVRLWPAGACLWLARLGGSASSLPRRQSPAARRAASSICAEPKTRTIAATVAVSFAGSVNVGRDGHLIIISGEVSGRWTSSTTSRSDWVTSPTAKNRSECLDGEWSTRLRFATSLSFP
jgi:hypothetical protein